MTKRQFYFYFDSIIKSFAEQKAPALCLVNKFPSIKKIGGDFKKVPHLKYRSIYRKNDGLQFQPLLLIKSFIIFLPGALNLQ